MEVMEATTSILQGAKFTCISHGEWVSYGQNDSFEGGAHWGRKRRICLLLEIVWKEHVGQLYHSPVGTPTIITRHPVAHHHHRIITPDHPRQIKYITFHHASCATRTVMILSRDMILCETESAGLFWDFILFFCTSTDSMYGDFWVKLTVSLSRIRQCMHFPPI
jgi:hypothetical protein